MSEFSPSFPLSVGDVTMTLVSAGGGRVAQLTRQTSAGAQQLLTGPEIHEENWGSTVWTSPQSSWGWPPPAELDGIPFASAQGDDWVEFRGPAVRSTAIAGLSLTKRYSVDRETNCFVLDYTVTNGSSSPQVVALWEITRVPRTSRAVFPAASNEPVKKFQPLLPLATDGSLQWLAYDPSTMNEDLLVGMHGDEGWLATTQGSTLLLKEFPVVPAERAAQGEASVLLFLSGLAPYIEVECQSETAHLAPGQSLQWQVRWYCCPMDPELSPAGIAALARRVLAEARAQRSAS